MSRQAPDTKKNRQKNEPSALLSVQESPILPQFFYAPVMETGGTHPIIFARETSESLLYFLIFAMGSLSFAYQLQHFFDFF